MNIPIYLTGMVKVNLGCGKDYRENWLNWDISHKTKADAYLDFSKDNFPIQDDIADEIYCSGVLEQILTNEGLVNCLNECWRILRPGGLMTIIVPNAKYSIAFRDPHDVRQFTPATFKYFIQGSEEYRLYGSVYGYYPWKFVSLDVNARGIMTVVLQML